MRSKPFAALAVAVGLLAVAGPMFAHHAGNVYDREHPITLQGTVTEFAFINPHVQIHFEAKDEQGNVVKWVAETSPPQRLYRAGWTTKSLKPGDEITITGAPYKDGATKMSVQRLVAPDGKELARGAE